MAYALLPCPFCGNLPRFKRTGTPKYSCIVVCDECGLSHESGDEEWNSGASWNMRRGHPWPHITKAASISMLYRLEGMDKEADEWLEKARAMTRASKTSP